MNLTEQLTEAIAGAHDTHLQRRHPNSREPRHLVVTHVFDVLEQKRFSLLRTQTVQRAIDLLAPRRAIGRMIVRRGKQREIIRGTAQPSSADVRVG